MASRFKMLLGVTAMTVVATLAGTGTASAAEGPNAPECVPSADPGWVCVYANQNRSGDNIGMQTCGREWPIPWTTTGTVDNRSSGARLLVTFTNGTTWLMPPYSTPAGGINWWSVSKVRLIC